MAIARVNTSKVATAGSNIPSQATPATSLTAGNLAVVAIYGPHPGTISTITDTAGNTYTLATAYTAASPHMYVYYAANCLGNASNQVTVTLGATSQFWWVFTLQYSGVATSSPLDVNTNGHHAAPDAADITVGPFTTTAANEVVVVAAGNNAFSTFTAGTDFTLVDGSIGSGSFFGGVQEYITSAILTSYTAHITSSISGGTNADSVAVVSFKAVVAAPTNSVAPVASGTATVGQALSTTDGTWTGSPTFTYQWQRDTGGNLSFSNIGSATANSYTLVDADDGNKVRCVVTGTNVGGNAAANSNALGLVIEPVPTNSVAPAVTGSTTLGSTLTSTTGTWAHQGGTVATYAYQWQRDVAGNLSYTNISSATASTYVLAAADDACNVRCVVTATNSGGAGTPANSNAILDTTPGGIGPTIVAKTGTSGSAVMQKAASGYTYVQGKTGGTGTAIAQKTVAGWTKVTGH